MFEKVGRGLLIAILAAAVILGGWLGFRRYAIEIQDRTVELCVDYKDIRKIASYERNPLGDVMEQIKEIGISSVGLFEETLPDAGALGEIYYAQGAGIWRLGEQNQNFRSLISRNLIKPNKTYLYVPVDAVRERFFNLLKLAVGEDNVGYADRTVIEVNAAEETLRDLGLGISEIQKEALTQKGFRIIPRVWNDPRWTRKNIEAKINTLRGYDVIIFDGEEILGYPDAIHTLAASMQRNSLKYGCVEIVKQDGDRSLKKLLGRGIVRVHSVPEDELKKITKDEAITRFTRAARERKIRLFYIRPFMPPQAGNNPIAYNLDYFSQVKKSIEQAGFTIGSVENTPTIRLEGWAIIILGMGVVVAALFLINYYYAFSLPVTYAVFIFASLCIFFVERIGYGTMLQKSLSLLAGVVFPTLAVVSTFSRQKKGAAGQWGPVQLVLNIIGETMIGVFIMIGLLTDHRFMLGIQTFSGVKIALIFPILLIALYFILAEGKGRLTERIASFLNTEVKLGVVVAGIAVIGALGVFVARSGNFVLPVPGIEKIFRDILENILYIRPRTKEFLIGYPLLFLAAARYLQGERKWLWLLAALGAIAPISVFNAFSHIHTPIMVSMIRTVNGLVLGILVGLLVVYIVDRFSKK